MRPGEEQTLGWRPAVGREMPGRAQWTLVEKLGEGGFGEVWLAQHARTQSKRVFKFCFDAERLRAMKREVVFFRLLKGSLGERRDVVRVIDYQFERPPFYLELGYCPRGNVARWAAGLGGIEKVALETRLRLVAETAEALAAAHSVGVLHKDIKPSNILIEEDADGVPRAVLTDFGIGVLTNKDLLAAHEITLTGFTHSLVTAHGSSLTGTRLYAPPETIAGKPFTVQGDVYALGVMLYQMVIGDLGRPLAAGWERGVADPLLREDVAACVEGDESRRLASARELAVRLRRLDERRADVARAEAARRAAQRRRRLARLATMGVVALVLLLGALSLWLVRERRLHKAERLGDLMRLFDAEIDAGEWDGERVSRLRGIAEEIAPLRPDQAQVLRERVAGKYEQYIAGLLRRAEIGAPLAEQIEGHLARLASFDAAKAAAQRAQWAERRADWQTVFDLHPPEFSGVAGAFRPGIVNVEGQRLRRSVQGAGQAEAILTQVGCERSAELSATFDEGWSGQLPLGLLLNATGDGENDSRYLFRLTRRAPERAATRAAATSATTVPAAGNTLRIQILRNNVLLREQVIDDWRLGKGPLALSARQEGERLTFVVGGLPPLVFDDAFPLARIQGGAASEGTFGVLWPARVGLLSLRGSRQMKPVAPSLLERGDDLYTRGDRDGALASYLSQLRAAEDADSRHAAGYKAGICLLELDREQEAQAQFDKVMVEGSDRWSALAALRLWLLHTRRGRLPEARAAYHLLTSRGSLAGLDHVLDWGVRQDIIWRLSGPFANWAVLQLGSDPARASEAAEMADLLVALGPLTGDGELELPRGVVRACFLTGQTDRAKLVASQLLAEPWLRPAARCALLEEYVWVSVCTGSTESSSVYHALELNFNEPGLRPALVERARFDLAGGRTREAEQSLDDYLAHEAPDDLRAHTSACLMRGLLHDRASHHDKAVELYRRGAWKPDLRAPRSGGTYALVAAAINGALAGDLPDADCEKFVRSALSIPGSGEFTADDNLAGVLRGGVFPLPHAVLREMWKPPRARLLIEQFAFHQIPPAEVNRGCAALACLALFRRDCAIDREDDPREALMWQTSLAAFDAYAAGKLPQPTLAALLAFYKGVMHPSGRLSAGVWESAMANLPPGLQAPIAYVFAQRCAGKGEVADARACYEFAISHSAGDAAVHGFAHQGLDELAGK